MGVFAMKWLAFVSIALWTGAAQAAVIHIKPTLAVVFDSQFNDVTETVVDINENGKARLRPSTAPYIMQVDFTFTISDLQEGQLGFGNAAFNIYLNGSVIQSPIAPGWNPDLSCCNGPGPMKPTWADNGDYGTPGDLKNMVVGIDPNYFEPVGNDPRREYGQHGAKFFGNLFLDIPGTRGTIGSLSIEGDGGSVYDANNKLVADGVTVTGGSIDFRVVPEPRSAILLGLGGMLLAVVGRRFQR